MARPRAVQQLPAAAFNTGKRARLRWAFMRQLEAIVLDAGGYAFGGYPRDRIIHDFYAEAFYAAGEDASRYDCATAHPESWPWRTLLPSDIDAYLPGGKAAVSALRAALTAAEMDVTLVQEARPAQLYALGNSHDDDGAAAPTALRLPCDALPEGLQHTKLRVSPRVHPLLRAHLRGTLHILPSVCIDVLYFDVPAPSAQPPCLPFGTVDFECNAVVLTPARSYELLKPSLVGGAGATGQVHPMRKHERLEAIMSDMLEGRAVAVAPARYRAQHMLDKGFTLQYAGVLTAVPRSVGRCYTGVCIICQGRIAHAYNHHLQAACGCDARYHFSCFAQAGMLPRPDTGARQPPCPVCTAPTRELACTWREVSLARCADRLATWMAQCEGRSAAERQGRLGSDSDSGDEESDSGEEESDSGEEESDDSSASHGV